MHVQRARFLILANVFSPLSSCVGPTAEHLQMQSLAVPGCLLLYDHFVRNLCCPCMLANLALNITCFHAVF